MLNVAIPPIEHLMRFAWMLDNNVLIEYIDKNGKKRLKKPNLVDKEIFTSVKLYLSGADQCYSIDESLENIDYYVGKQISLYGRDFVRDNL